MSSGVKLSGAEPQWAALGPVLRRLQVSTDPEQFMIAVTAAYQVEQGAEWHQSMPDRFRSSESFQDFKAALRIAASLNSDPTILALGCGRGFAGISAEFAAETTGEIFPQREVATFDFDAANLNPPSKDGEVDLVVAHSLLHFVVDLKSLFQFLRRQLLPRATLVFAHESNAVFWRHPRLPELVQLQADSRGSQTVSRMLLKPLRSVRNAIRIARGKYELSLLERVNLRLRQSLLIHGGLTAGELAAIVDPHLPSQNGMQLGRRGIDWQEIQEEFLPDFQIIFETSNGSRIIPATVSQAAGLPGAVSSAVFLREATI